MKEEEERRKKEKSERKKEGRNVECNSWDKEKNKQKNGRIKLHK